MNVDLTAEELATVAGWLSGVMAFWTIVGVLIVLFLHELVNHAVADLRGWFAARRQARLIADQGATE